MELDATRSLCPPLFQLSRGMSDTDGALFGGLWVTSTGPKCLPISGIAPVPDSRKLHDCRGSAYISTSVIVWSANLTVIIDYLQLLALPVQREHDARACDECLPSLHRLSMASFDR